MPDNSVIAELLAREAETAGHPINRALKKAARAAFGWPEEAATVLTEGRSLTELTGIGPYLARLITRWFESSPQMEETSDLRRDFLTTAEAKKILASHPDWSNALRGDLQMHTEWSDGSGSIKEMAEAGQARGYDYIAITDHAKGLKIAGGMNEKDLEEQGREIDAVNSVSNKHTPKVLRSIELNLDVKGQGDMEAGALEKLDIVLGAFHSALRRTDDQTERYLAALKNKDIQILGHPRGRIYNYRLGLKADWKRVFALAAELDKAVEIDCYPDRQDLNVELLRLAKKAGVRISLGTDSHHPWQMQFIELGLAAAILAKIPRDRILNFLSREHLVSWVNKVRGN